jgi:hypothetical protein
MFEHRSSWRVSTGSKAIETQVTVRSSHLSILPAEWSSCNHRELLSPPSLFFAYVRVCPTCCTVIQNHISFFIIRKFASYKVTVVDLLCYCVGFTWCSCVPGWLLSSDTKTTCMLLHRIASLVLMLLIL